MPNARPSRLTNSCSANATGAPGHERAILSVMSRPSIIDSHSRPSATKAEARDRYQYPFGFEPTMELARLAPTPGSRMNAPSVPSATPRNTLTSATLPSAEDLSLVPGVAE